MNNQPSQPKKEDVTRKLRDLALEDLEPVSGAIIGRVDWVPMDQRRFGIR